MCWLLAYVGGFILTALIERLVSWIMYVNGGDEYDEDDQEALIFCCFFWPGV